MSHMIQVTQLLHKRNAIAQLHPHTVKNEMEGINSAKMSTLLYKDPEPHQMPDSNPRLLAPVCRAIPISHRLISRDRPTKTGSLCLHRPFFYVAALSVYNVHIRVVDG